MVSEPAASGLRTPHPRVRRGGFVDGSGGLVNRGGRECDEGKSGEPMGKSAFPGRWARCDFAQGCSVRFAQIGRSALSHPLSTRPAVQFDLPKSYPSPTKDSGQCVYFVPPDFTPPSALPSALRPRSVQFVSPDFTPPSALPSALCPRSVQFVSPDFTPPSSLPSALRPRSVQFVSPDFTSPSALPSALRPHSVQFVLLKRRFSVTLWSWQNPVTRR